MVEQRIPLRGFPMRTFIYEITEEFYAVNDDEREALIVYLRDSYY